MTDFSKIPADCVGLRLCKVTRCGDLVLCEGVIFEQGRAAVETILRRAEVSGFVGEVGETGDFWADFLTSNGDWTETISLSQGAWNSLKNHWMRCKVARP